MTQAEILSWMWMLGFACVLVANLLLIFRLQDVRRERDLYMEKFLNANLESGNLERENKLLRAMLNAKTPLVYDWTENPLRNIIYREDGGE